MLSSCTPGVSWPGTRELDGQQGWLLSLPRPRHCLSMAQPFRGTPFQWHTLAAAQPGSCQTLLQPLRLPVPPEPQLGLSLGLCLGLSLSLSLSLSLALSLAFLQKPAEGMGGWGGRRRPSPASSWLLDTRLAPADRTMPKAITQLPEAEESHMYRDNLASGWFSKLPSHTKRCSTVSKLTFFYICM